VTEIKFFFLFDDATEAENNEYLLSHEIEINKSTSFNVIIKKNIFGVRSNLLQSLFIALHASLIHANNEEKHACL
jgi:hypothetical protein